MAKLSAIKNDPTKVKSGVWVLYAEDIELKIASLGSPEYQEMRERLLKPYARQVRSGLLSNQKVLDLIKPAVAQHILLDWRNLEDEAGKAIPFSPDKALELFNNPLYGLYDYVLEAASQEQLFRAEDAKQAVKN